MMLGSLCSPCCCPGQGGIEALRNAESVTANVTYAFSGQLISTVYDYSFSGEYTLPRTSTGQWSTGAFDVVGQGFGGSQTRSMSLSASLQFTVGNPGSSGGFSESSRLLFRLNRLTKVADTFIARNWPEQGHIGFGEMTCSGRPLFIDPAQLLYARTHGDFASFWINEALNWGRCVFTITRDGITAYDGECDFGWGGNFGVGPTIAPQLFSPPAFTYNVLSNKCGNAHSKGLIGNVNDSPVSVRLQWEKGNVYGVGFPQIDPFLTPIRYDEQLTVNSLVANFSGFSQNLLMNVQQPLWRPETMEIINVYVPLPGGDREFVTTRGQGVLFNTVTSQCQQ